MVDRNQAGASSSSERSSAVEFKYDVFLSFRGPDTRRSITSQLFDMLQNKRGIKTFMDGSDLKAGDPISPSLLKAIEDSRFAIVVLSPNYASSTWCLVELAHICEHMQDENRIFPLFYDVEPSAVRFCKRSFGEAFEKHESSKRHSSDRMQQWREALNKVAGFSGWTTKDIKTDDELVKTIVDFVCGKVQPTGIEFTLSTGDFGAYDATRKAMDEVMTALKTDDVTVVGVDGMGGVGKTTMVKHVAAQSRKIGMFHHVIMGVVSQSPDFVKLQGTLAHMLGVKLEQDGRAASLYEEIMKREKLLIILDDVWRRTELKKIGIPSYKDLQMRNSKVLLTTRIKGVCDRMDCQRKITLGTLSQDDSWTLFERNAGISFESKKFKDVGKKVAGECRGLPIALIAVARALKGKDQAEWQLAARRLEKSQFATVEDEQEAFESIRLSYDYLKSEDSKACFLLCCLYPEDHDIPIRNLIKYAIGTGLFRAETETIEEARETAVSVVKYLKDSSLLLEGEKNGCVKLHDVVRDTALNIAKSEDGHRIFVKAGCGLEVWPSERHEDCNAISLMRNRIRKLPEEELACPHLQILLLNRNDSLRGIPEKFIQSLTQLRLLDLSRTNISLLPRSFSFLTNLQALYLDFCRHIDMSIVGKLKKLEILSMRDCWIEKLREVRHLTNLRILDVSQSSLRGLTVPIIPSGVISKLQKLEELYMVNCGLEDWGSKFDSEGEETDSSVSEREEEEETEDPQGKTEGEGEEAEDSETNVESVQEETELSFAGLPKLKILHVCISNAKCIPKNLQVKPDWDYFYIRVGDFEYESDLIDHHSRSLFLKRATMSTLPDWFVKAVAPKTEQLEYMSCYGIDIVEEYDHGRLYEVKLLKISYSDFEELINTTRRVQEGPVFEKLEELHLLNLYDLKELCVGELPPGSLCNLKVLHIFHCRKLKNVSKLVQRLPDLEKLYLNTDEPENVFESGGLEPERSELREMHLVGPSSMKSISSGPPPRVMLQSLKSVTFLHRPMLQCLFASDVAECLVQLEDLFVGWCPLLERIIEEVKNEKTVLPKLKNLVLTYLPKLYGESGTADIECPLLEKLNVLDCPQFPFSVTTNLFYKSRNQFSFSTSASDYFGSTNPVKLNDQQLYKTLIMSTGCEIDGVTLRFKHKQGPKQPRRGSGSIVHYV